MQPCYEAFEGSQFLAAWMAGNLAGALNGIALNPASAIKCVRFGLCDCDVFKVRKGEGGKEDTIQ